MAAVLSTAVLSLAAIDRERQLFTEPAAAALVAQPVAVAARLGNRGALPEVVAAVRAARRGAGLPRALTPPIDKLRYTPAPYSLPRGCVSRDDSSESRSKVCRVGRTTSRKLLVLIGDSHALMWLPAVTDMALRDGWALVPLLRTGCMPNRWVTDEGPESCRRWYRWAISQVRRLNPLVTLVGGSIGERQTTTARAATDGILATARALQRSGRVVVIGDPEGLSQDPIDCLLSRHASMASCTTTWPPESLLSYNRVAAGAKRLGVGFIATRGFVCFERRCPSVIGHTIAYWDNSHLSTAYAVRVAGAFRAAFLRARPNSSRSG